MKKVIITVFISVLFLTVVHGQHTMSEKEAQQYLEKAWSYLKTSDSTSFINLWQLDNSASPKLLKPYSRKQAIGHFNYISEFLDTALTRKLIIDHIAVERNNLKDTDTEYWIKAWFKYNEHYFKGFGFYLAYVNGRWVVRGNPSTSTMERDPVKKK